MTRDHDISTIPKSRVLYVGQSYYNTWYLSRALRKRGWKADTLNLHSDPRSKQYFHGEDFEFQYRGPLDVIRHVLFFVCALFRYDIFHFSGAHGLTFFLYLQTFFKNHFFSLDVRLLKFLGKVIVYSNNGCLDGVAQSSFRTWLPEPVCDICRWRDVSHVCSDKRNLAWGKLRNSLADFQIINGGNRKDYNIDPRIHEVPEFYCLDPAFWAPDLLIPANFLLPFAKDTVKVLHAVGEFESRTQGAEHKNIKCTHIYVPVVQRLQSEGYPVELLFFRDVPNKQYRFYQLQADIVVDMLTFGFFGANLREAMMLGKPVVCFLRTEWLESMRKEVPEYVDDLPVVSATPETIYEVLKDLITHPDKRERLGRKGREFALKWHTAEAGARRLDQIYTDLLRSKES